MVNKFVGHCLFCPLALCLFCAKMDLHSFFGIFMTDNTSDSLFGESLLDNERPVQEKDLLFPILLILAKADTEGHGPVTTFQLYSVFKDLFALSEEDEQVVRRSVTRFRRTLDNVFSHDLLTRDKLVERADLGWEITPRGRAFLLDYMLEPKDPLPNGEMRVSTAGDRVVESVIAFQMLVRLAELQKSDNTPISTTQLRKDIKSSIPLSVSDLYPLKNRSDTKIDQIARNVISHNTMTKSGWCTRSEKGLTITDKGKARVLDYLLEAFPAPDFGFLLRKDNEFRAQVNTRRAEVATEAAARRKARQKP